MALYDNKYWLLSHIRNSFISTDDTGMCEVVMTGESKQFKEQIATLEPYPEPDDSEDDDDMELASYDLQMDLDFVPRERPNIYNRLEKLDQAKRKQAKMKHIKWETRRNPMTSEQLDDMFVKKDLNQTQSEAVQKSPLTEIIHQHTNCPLNPYMEFAKFDGSGQVKVAIKRYRIFLTMLPEDQRNYPIGICCIASAKIHDLIGLILLKSSTKYEDYAFKPVPNYGLFITEEDGEVDRDFPCLDAKECVAKFGFTCLGLVEHKDPKYVSFDRSETITIAGPIGGGFSKNIKSKKSARESQLEEQTQTLNDLLLMDDHNKAMEAPLYQSYRVHIVHRVRSRIEILLGISGEKIEIDPVVQKTSKFNLVKQRAISHHMDTVASCDVTDKRTNRTTFRVVYDQPFSAPQQELSFTGNASSYPPSAVPTLVNMKHYDFEADNATVGEIVQKINLILDLRSSATRKDYLASLQRKHYKRKVFNVK